MSVLVVVGRSEAAQGWYEAMRAALPEEEVIRDDGALDRASVMAAVVADPPEGALRGLPNLRLIQSLWAGVDGLLRDASLPAGVPLARLVDPALTAAMVESALLHVLSLHRQMPAYRASQAAGVWRPLPQPTASMCGVGVLGLGALGRAVATTLAGLGFAVRGWSRSPRSIEGIACLHGPDGLSALLSGSRILVNLLPLTGETTGLLCADLFARLPRGAGVINLGRGASLVEADLIAALDGGQLGHAVIDVLGHEPAPASHPFWRHPAITLMPHVAAASDREGATRIAAQAVRDLRAGRPVANLVDRGRAY